jgi:glycosyltransferase involved in cell wall biosynthesis
MKLLLCCESYWPYRGGVQEVMRQIAERLVRRGHDVTVATSRHRLRKANVINGVKIQSFNAGGKMPYGLHGRIDEYRTFVKTFGADALLVMAAQQWSFDALWAILDQITARKVLIPCGFSSLYSPDFARYYSELPDVLRKFDHLIFNAEKYRDIDFVRNIGLDNFTVLPNGISEADFGGQADGQFRKRQGIADDAFLFLTVGNPIEAKGHRQVIDAFSRLDTSGQTAVLLSIADWAGSSLFHRAMEIIRLEGYRGITKRLHRKANNTAIGAAVRFVEAAVRRVQFVFRTQGWNGIRQLILHRFSQRPMIGIATVPATVPLRRERLESIGSIAERIAEQPLKRVILKDFDRYELVQAYFAADLFVFASQIEYSPLVLFEAAASGTPFLTVPVGNADEIVRWTGGGMLCEASKDERGNTRVSPETLAGEMARCMNDRERLSRLGATARERWRKYFTWAVVIGYYEDILAGRKADVRIMETSAMAGEPKVSSAS